MSGNPSLEFAQIGAVVASDGHVEEREGRRRPRSGAAWEEDNALDHRVLIAQQTSPYLRGLLPSQNPFSLRWCLRSMVGAIAAAAMIASVGVVNVGSAAASSAAPTTALAQSSDVAASAVDEARGQLGTPYSWGGNGPDAFDCSGLVHWSYEQAGVSLPRTTQSQVDSGSAVARDNLQLGDLLFFYSGNSHVGIYAGDNTMVHAPSSGSSVRVDSLSGYWDGVFSTARRVA